MPASPYEQLSRVELIHLLEERDRESNERRTTVSSESPTIKRIISEVLALLFNEENQPIEKAMHLLLDYFNADWGYVAIFGEDGITANFPYEVMSEWVQVPKDDQSQLTYETIPWIIDTVKMGHDIVLCDMNNLPEEAFIDKRLLTEQQLKSMLAIPLTFHNKVQGFIGIDSVRQHRFWTTVEVEDMHLTALLFSILIERWQTQHNEEESRKRIAELSTKFQQFFYNLPLGVGLYNTEGYLINGNEAYFNIFEVPREEIGNINMYHSPIVSEKIKRNIRKGKAVSFSFKYDFDKVIDAQYYHSKRKGKVKHLSCKGIGLRDKELGDIGTLLIVSDETEMRTKEEQTENNLAILKAVLHSGQSIVGEYQKQRGELTFSPELNGDLEDNQLFNFLKDKSPFTLADLRKMTGPSDNIEPLLRVMEGKEEHCNLICRFIIANEQIWIRANAQAYKAKNSKYTGKVICHFTNITEEKLMEEKLRHAEYETRRSEMEMQRVREADMLKSAFLANMSHEIRTPLNAIVGFSNILSQTDVRADEKEEYVTLINKNSDLLLRLITDILDFSKIESGRLDYSLATIQLKDICREQYRVHSLKIPAEVKLVCDLDALPEVSLYTDPKRITQVISNLLSNAAKFTETGSITLSYRIIEKYVLVEVIDTGIGIDPKNIDAIFERFVKMDSFKQGTGLGLTICKTIIEALNGTIGVESESGKGSRFWFTLPIE